MSLMRYSPYSLGSNTVPVPVCDAWGHIRADTAPSLLDGSGVSAVSLASAGLYNINFSNPERFGGGGYVILYTPEVRTETCLLSCQRDMGGSTAAGKTAGIQISTWRFFGPVGAGGNTAQQSTPAANTNYINFAAFSLSQDTELRSPSGGTYALVPGASGYGLTGSTYSSHHISAISKRSAIAYGSIVMPPKRSNSSPFSVYVEMSSNIQRVEAVDGGPEYDVYFTKPMNNTSYAVIMCAEAEPFESGPGLPYVQEYSLPIVVRGTSDQHKTVSKFRIRHIKQSDTNNSWESGNFVSMQSGKTERIHFMVFGGGTYGQP